MAKTLILYYSFEESTHQMANYLANELNLPIERIRVIKDLKSHGFSKYIVGGGQVVMKIKPKLMPLTSNINEYEHIIIGSPIWAGSYVPAIKTLLENGQLTNKKISFFFCHDGGPNKANDKIIELVNRENQLISTYALERVSENFLNLKAGLLNWAKKDIER